MLLKSLRLHNFRQYKGDQTIAFSTDPDRNVTAAIMVGLTLAEPQAPLINEPWGPSVVTGK